MEINVKNELNNYICTDAISIINEYIPTYEKWLIEFLETMEKYRYDSDFKYSVSFVDIFISNDKRINNGEFFGREIWIDEFIDLIDRHAKFYYIIEPRCNHFHRKLKMKYSRNIYTSDSIYKLFMDGLNFIYNMIKYKIE